ncbi:MAG TPA: GNAT family protein [Chloroflexota bacterium]|jgi:RimJ/RimL family protein N-acetyltransferase|nr:GNAT family protein [Chloroflexota bacterium]
MDRRPADAPDVLLTDGTVLLRLPDARDSAAIRGYGQDPDVEETGWLPVPVPCPPEVAAHVCQEFQQGWQGRFGLTLVITMPPDVDLRGVVHLSVHADGVGEIAYGLAPRYRRRGLATRAVRLVAAWAFAQLGLRRLEIVVTAQGTNGLTSRRVAEKADFVYAGIRRTHLPATGRDYEDPLYVLPAPGTGA